LKPWNPFVVDRRWVWGRWAEVDGGGRQGRQQQIFVGYDVKVVKILVDRLKVLVASKTALEGVNNSRR
jgi:hypothetical protein